MNLKDLYKPIGRLYEEVPSADYAGDYLAANGGWNNVVEDYEPLIALNKKLQALEEELKIKEESLRFLTAELIDCKYDRAASRSNRGYYCINRWYQYDNKIAMETNRDKILPPQIADLKAKIKDIKENQIPKANADKLAGAKASKDVVLKDLETLQTKTIEESKQKQTAADLEAKQKQTEAELRAKKIFLAIIASGLILSAAGFALLRK